MHMLRSCSRFRPSLRTARYSSSKVDLNSLSLQIGVLREEYQSGNIQPVALFEALDEKIRANLDNNAWIFRPPTAHTMGQALALEKEMKDHPEGLFQRKPLFGVPFTVKDNWDVAGYPTTSGCPGFAFTPWKTSNAIKKLEQAGAIMVGKTNMDQFATGLVGVRSPYGTPVNPFNKDYCPGGSSSGSGVVVSTGLCSFSIGTDTAGSGRIPASFTNIVGLKPTPGLVSSHGMLPACRSLDCFSVFALSCDDAFRVLQLAKGYDQEDEYSVHEPPVDRQGILPPGHAPRLGIPRNLAFFGDTRGARELYDDACDRLTKTTGATFVEIDFTPFTEVARVLYEGPWVAERLSVLEQFFKSRGDEVLPITRNIIAKGANFTAVDTFRAQRRLEALRHQAYKVWEDAGIDALVCPTASITPTIAEVNEVPIGVNTVLGFYTNFVNLLNLSALAIPNGFLPSGQPTGITLIGRDFHDRRLYEIGRAFQQDNTLTLGATGHKLHEAATDLDLPKGAGSKHLSGETKPVVVVGAHLSGMPLNYQLTDISASLSTVAKTAPTYKLYDVSKSESETPRPGLVRVEGEPGDTVEIEVWNVPVEHYAKFLDCVKPPLAIGNVELEDGSIVKGFVAEGYGVKGAKDITSYGGWRKYIKETRS